MTMEEDRMGSQPKEVWASGEAYEPYVGRWSRHFAGELLEWLAVPHGSNWLDVGCGTGALTQTILQVAAPRRVKGIDAAEGFIEYVRAKVTTAAGFSKGMLRPCRWKLARMMRWCRGLCSTSSRTPSGPRQR
jgi:trans-aconitate methyltransferase